MWWFADLVSKARLGRGWRNLAKYYGLSCTGLKLVPLLQMLINYILGILLLGEDLPADDLLSVLRIRMIENIDEQNVTMETFMDVEGSHMNFLPKDRDSVVQTAKNYKLLMEHRDEYVMDFHQLHNALKPPQPTVGPPGKVRKRPKAGAEEPVSEK